MLLVSRSGEIVACNRKMGKLIGVPPQALRGRFLFDLLSNPSTVVEEYLSACSRVREIHPGSLTLACPSEERIPCGAQGYVVEPGGESRPALLLLRLIPKSESPSKFALLNQQVDRLKKEIMLRRQVEETLRIMDRRKDRFLAMLGHELRNPLNTINNAVFTLKRTGSDPHLQERARAIIERQVQQMNRIICDLLDVSRITQGRMPLERERVDLTQLIEQIVEDQRWLFDEAGITLTHRTPETPLRVRGDVVRLNQSICNLLHNSRKFTSGGGKVSIELEEWEGRAFIRVVDTGAGIAPDRLSALFDTFAHEETHQDRKHGGLGLGLPLVKGLVELHGGTMELLSEGEGKGTEVRISLPLERTLEES